MQKDWLFHERNRAGKGAGRILSLFICVFAIYINCVVMAEEITKHADGYPILLVFDCIGILLFAWWLFVVVQGKGHYTVDSLSGMFSYRTLKKHLKTQDFTRAFINPEKKYEVLTSEDWILVRVRSKSYFYPKKMILAAAVNSGAVHGTKGYSYEMDFYLTTGYFTSISLNWMYDTAVGFFNQLKPIFPEFQNNGVGIWDEKAALPTLSKFVSKGKINCMARYPVFNFHDWFVKNRHAMRKQYKELKKSQTAGTFREPSPRRLPGRRM